MAVVYSTYTKSASLAKANIRYIQHRRGKDGEKLTRQLFGFEGNIAKTDAYTMIDAAPDGTYFYRISFNPDLLQEDGSRDLDLRTLTRDTLRALEEHLGRPLAFVAAVHADHTERRHVNLLALLPSRLNRAELTALRNTLTQEATDQRRELDRQREREQEQTREESSSRKAPERERTRL